jgi:hypothetical protein
MIHAKFLGSTPTIDSIATQVKWQIHPGANRSGEVLKELSKSIYKKFKQHPLDREPYHR